MVREQQHSVLLQFDRVSFAWSAKTDGANALASVSFAVRAGARVWVAGGNGAGKSTLAALAAGLIAPTTGTVAIEGRATTAGEGARHFWMEMRGIVTDRIARWVLVFIFFH